MKSRAGRFKLTEYARPTQHGKSLPVFCFFQKGELFYSLAGMQSRAALRPSRAQGRESAGRILARFVARVGMTRDRRESHSVDPSAGELQLLSCHIKGIRVYGGGGRGA